MSKKKKIKKGKYLLSDTLGIQRESYLYSGLGVKASIPKDFPYHVHDKLTMSDIEEFIKNQKNADSKKRL
jgi:hypothetical protein